MMTTYLLLIFLAIAIFHLCTRYDRRGRLVNKIQGPTDYPLVGNLLAFNETCLHRFFMLGRVHTKKYYPIGRYWTCTFPLVSLTHPDDIEILFTSQKAIDKGYVYNFLHPWLKTGLLTSTGEKWRHRRKILTTAFHFNILEKYFEIINDEGKKCIEMLKEETPETTSLIPFCLKHTLNIICQAAMGVNLDKMNVRIVNEYKKAIHDYGYLVVYRMQRPYIFDWMMNLPIWKYGYIQTNAVKILNKFTDKVVKARKEYHESTANKYLYEHENVKFEATSTYGRKKRLALLDLLLAAEKNGLIDEEGVKEEVATFTFEGHDTVGMVMAFALLLFAENKEIQDCARLEITEILDKNGGEIDMANIQELHYLERCIKETMRLYPPVSTLLRRLTDDIQLKHAFVPKGTQIIIHLYDLHRDPNFWTEPEKFDPDRFLPERSKGRHPFAYTPFSAGPRNCIGQKFAMMELKLVLARILYDFYLEPIDRTCNIKLYGDIVLRTLEPIHTKFIRIVK